MNEINVLQIICIVAILFLIRKETKHGFQLDKKLNNDEKEEKTGQPAI